MPFRSGSAEELEEQSGGILLPEDEYLAEVTAMTLWPASEQQPTQYTPEPVDQYKVDLTFRSFADGSDLEDENGNPVPSPFIVKAIINHNKMGLVPQASKARKFMAACLRQPINKAIEIATFPDDLVGKQLYVSTLNKNGWTRAQDFRPIKIERQRPSETVEAAPAAGSTASDSNDEITF